MVRYYRKCPSGRTLKMTVVRGGNRHTPGRIKAMSGGGGLFFEPLVYAVHQAVNLEFPDEPPGAPVLEK